MAETGTQNPAPGENGNGVPQVGNPGTSTNEGDPGSQQQQQQQQTQTEKEPTVEELKARLAKEQAERQAANAEAAKHRAELNKYKKAEEDRELANKTDLEKAQIELQKAQAEAATAKSQALDAQIQALAATKGFADPTDAIALVDRTKLEAGQTLEQLVDELAKAKPHLLKTGSSNLSTGTSVTNPTGKVDEAAAKAQVDRAKSLFPALGRLRIG